MHKKLALFACASLLLAPLAASALSRSGDGDIDPEPIDSCIDLQNNLSYRSNDINTRGEVSLLQDFLQANGFLNSEPTGFFGLLTQAAARQYQASVGLDSTGFVGPLTRGKIRNDSCNKITPEESFSASPSSGTAPLMVNFTGTVSAGNYALDFGDGSRPARVAQDCDDAALCAALSVNELHRYKKAGTYTATLSTETSIIGHCDDGALCHFPQEQVIGTAVITVTDKSLESSFSASPKSGQAPLAVTFTSRTGTKIDFGDGTSESFSYCLGIGCETKGFAIEHIYRSAGTYTARALNWQDRAVGRTTITVKGGTSQSFTASPASGTVPLSVTFANMIGGPVQGSTVIRYGDGSSDLITRCVEGGTTPDTCSNAGLNRHTYTTAGTYTARLVNIQCIGSASACETVWGTATITVRETATGSSLSASPTSGSAPLNVTFRGTGDGASYFGGVHIDFGDGNEAIFCYPGSSCTEKTVTHTFTSAGTYAAKLYGVGEGTRSDLGSITVVVRSGSTATLTASPTSGSAPLYVEFPAAGIREGRDYTIDFGDGTTSSALTKIGQSSATGESWCTSTECSSAARHTYTSVGTYVAKLSNSSGSTLGTVTITVGGSAAALNTTSSLASVAAALSSSQPQSAPSAPFTYRFTQDLYRGQTGAEVRALQEALKAEGLFADESTGVYLDKTVNAVKKFQAKYGIKATGYVGPATRAKLNELFSR